MTLKVLEFTGETYGRVEPSNVLDGAKELDLQDVFVIGIKRDGCLYLASSEGDSAFLLKLLKLTEIDIFSRIDLLEGE